MTPENSEHYALDGITGFSLTPDVDIIRPQLSRSSSSDLTTPESFESHALMERSNLTASLGRDHLQHSNLTTQGCPSTVVPSDTIHSLDAELRLPWNMSYQEHYSELQNALSGPELTTTSDDKGRILKTQWVELHILHLALQMVFWIENYILV
ncbi:hypothetical protein N7523_010233 [Penicillium sp. IBT 18751x]|nr:hypothetical protein N7523_010233 [Penicillium sp. IBT 18751x]